MTTKETTLEELSSKAHTLSTKQAVVGFDGFVDRIMAVVNQRSGAGENYTAMPHIEDLGNRILAAAGKSTNIELYPKFDKLGGNGPIMANALQSAGARTRYIGALGKPAIHPVFEDFAKRTDAVSIAEPGMTFATEFTDGKILFGIHADLDQVTYPNIISAMGEGPFLDLVSRADLFAMVNWTMLPAMTEILTSVVEQVLPNYGPHDNRIFFFDLADPDKRSDGDIRSLLAVLKRFGAYGRPVLGLNLKEAQRLCQVLGQKEGGSDPDSLKSMASRLRQAIDVYCVVVHPTESAACATKEDSWYVKGPFTENPKITTGAGDHFNAGFVSGMLCGLSMPACLAVAVAFSGFYVRSAKSPTITEAESFIRSW